MNKVTMKITHVRFIDKVHLQKYTYMINQFLSDKITASAFEEHFLATRREDQYWMSSSFQDEVGRIMDEIFLDVDEYSPDGLYVPDNAFNINEVELRIRLNKNLTRLRILTDLPHL